MKKKILILFCTTITIIICTYGVLASIFNHKYNTTIQSCDKDYINKNNSIDDNNAIKSNNTKPVINSKNIKTSQTASANNTGSVKITIQEFVNNMQCSSHIVEDGETLNNIAENYSSTCNLNSAVKLIKAANKIDYDSNIFTGSSLKIPEILFKNGVLHTVVAGDTLSKLCSEYYPIYDLNYIMNLIIYINDLPDTNISLGTTIFLPTI